MSAAIKETARKIKRAVTEHGVVHVFIDDCGKAHAVPGHSVELIGVYSAPVRQADIEEDLHHAEAEQ